MLEQLLKRANLKRKKNCNSFALLILILFSQFSIAIHQNISLCEVKNCLLYSLLYPQSLEQHWPNSQCLIQICGSTMKTNNTCFTNFFKHRLVYTIALWGLNHNILGAMPNAISSMSILPIKSEKAFESTNDHKFYVIPVSQFVRK